MIKEDLNFDEQDWDWRYYQTLDTLRGKSTSGAINFCAKQWQRLVRIGNSDEYGKVKCISCDHVATWNNNMEGGHFMSRRHRHTVLPVEPHELTEINCNPQCNYCNRQLHGNKDEYERALIEKHGAKLVRQLKDLALEEYEFSLQELAQMTVDFRQEIRDHEKRLKGN